MANCPLFHLVVTITLEVDIIGIILQSKKLGLREAK